MQIVIAFAALLIITALVIYKINGKFEFKELLILVGIVSLVSIASYFYVDTKKETIPNLFKEKYERDNNLTILKISSQRIDNKQLASSKDFEFNFNYIIQKDGAEFVCKLDGVKIIKIEDEFVFENFDSIEEKCSKK